jgi:diaminopimelate epimerase
MQEFYKYHGAGNDFILIDNRDNHFVVDNEKIAALCNRRLGIGGDGLILLHASANPSVDFDMQYFNADGFEGSMCGNGGRCIVALAQKLGIINNNTVFSGTDGLHKAAIIASDRHHAEICLQMKDVEDIRCFEDGYFLDTGSPHFVKFTENVHAIDVKAEGENIRRDVRFEHGTNVNFVQTENHFIYVRTFERGVEDETLSCGTGVTASALAWAKAFAVSSPVAVKSRGGTFTVSFRRENHVFTDIWLQGETCFVFKGEF